MLKCDELAGGGCELFPERKASRAQSAERKVEQKRTEDSL